MSACKPIEEIVRKTYGECTSITRILFWLGLAVFILVVMFTTLELSIANFLGYLSLQCLLILVVSLMYSGTCCILISLHKAGIKCDNIYDYKELLESKKVSMEDHCVTWWECFIYRKRDHTLLLIASAAFAFVSNVL